MPSPVGHALAGIAVALAADDQAARRGLKWFLTRPLTVVAVVLATAPDADLALSGFHRTVTHSIGGTALVTIVAILVTGWVTRYAVGRTKPAPGSGQPAVASPQTAVGSRPFAWGVVLVCMAAHATHLLTDWLGADFSQPAGIQLLWPFSGRWFISGWDVFPRIERRQIFSATSMAINAQAIIWEVVVVVPLIALLWVWRIRRSRARLTNGVNPPAGPRSRST
jgi:membrane-bound metal-dependent hydrolase YbcI (DUF457 family)